MHDVLQMLPRQPSAHGVGFPCTHAPLPLQTEGSVATLAVHEPDAQGKLNGFFAPHAPVPLHVPVPSQGIWSEVHSSSGSDAAAMLPHTPSVPLPFFVVVHATHEPAQAVSQQTPSAQNPLLQPPGTVHAPPGSCFSAHAPPSQNAVETQLLSLMHVVRHAAALHR